MILALLGGEEFVQPPQLPPQPATPREAAQGLAGGEAHEWREGEGERARRRL